MLGGSGLMNVHTIIYNNDDEEVFSDGEVVLHQPAVHLLVLVYNSFMGPFQEQLQRYRVAQLQELQ